MKHVWHEAVYRLRGKRRSASLLACARLSVFVCCAVCGSMLQRILLRADPFGSMPNRWDLFLPCALTVTLLFIMPLRMQTAWQLGVLSGLLDDNDNSFLAYSSSLWLWQRAFRVRLLSGLCLTVSAAPALMLLLTAKALWLTI